MKKNLTMQFRSGAKVSVSSLKEFFDFWNAEDGWRELSTIELSRINNNGLKIRGHYITFNYRNKVIKFYFNSSKQLDNTLGMIADQFFKEQYKWLNVRDKVVIDIGANIGDTAIYFALNGAKHVYAFEPYPYSYEIAKRNIKLNKLEGKVTLFNEAVSAKGEYITINPNFENTEGSDLKEFAKGTKVRITTLEEIVERLNIKRAVLKMDCEGCEYAVLLNASYETLSHFDQIMVEYHYGYRNFRKVKKIRFKLKHTSPFYLYNREAEKHEMYVGMIIAEKFG